VFDKGISIFWKYGGSFAQKTYETDDIVPSVIF
jgi:hypothetical protein